MADAIDAFLDAPEASTTDPIDSFLDAPSPGEHAAQVHKASKILQEVAAGKHPDMTEEELLPIVKVASQDSSGNQTTPASRLVHQAGNVADVLINPARGYEVGKELVQQAGTGLKNLYGEVTKDPSKAAVDAIVGGAGKTVQFAGETLGNATTGTANLISQVVNSMTGKTVIDPDLTNARSVIAQGQMNKGIEDTVRSTGANPDSTAAEAGGLAMQSLIPIGGEAKAAGVVAKTADALAETAPKAIGTVLEKGAQAGQNKWVQAATVTAAGHPMAGLGILGEGALEKVPVVGRYLRSWKKQVMDATLGKVEGLGADLRAIPEGPYRDGLIQDAQSVVDKNNARLASITAKEEIGPDAYVFQRHDDGSFIHPEEFLPKPEKEIRRIQIENDNQAAKITQINHVNDFTKVAGYATKLGLSTAGNVGVGSTIGGLIGGVNAQPGDDESAKRMAVMGAMISAPFAPFQASGALRDIRMEAGREAFMEAGKDSITTDHPNYDAHQEAYGKLDQQGKDTIDVANGMLKSMGGKAVIILPKEEFLKMQGGDATKATGRGFVKDGNIYLNADKMASGVVHHELTHFLPQALGQSAFDIMPDLKAKMEGKQTSQAYKDMESYYNSISPDASKTNIPEEVLAETGRRIMNDMPPELFYGGESGADVLKRWGGKILEKAAPSWYRENNIDPILKTPISKADEAAVRAKLFEIGARRGQEPPRNAPDESPATTIPPDPSKRATEPTVTLETPISAPPGAVEALTGLGEPKKSAQAKVDAATAEIQSEGGTPTLEEVVRRATQRTVPVPIESPGTLRQGSAPETPRSPQAVAPESPLSQAKAPPEGRSDVAKAPPAPAPIEEIQKQSAPTSHNVPTKKGSQPEDIAPNQRNASQDLGSSGEVNAQGEGMSSENPMLVGPRTDKYGKKSVSGRIFDPELPEHAALAEKAGLDEANIAKLKELSDKMGETVGIDYSHAPEEGEGRKEAQKKTLVQARIEGAKREKLSKTFVPSWIEFTSGTGKAVVRGFSPDKFFENAKTVFDKYPEVMEGKYKDVSDPQLISDFQKYAQNHANGYTGMGKPIEGTELTPVKPNPSFEPHILPEDRANVINLLMGDTSAAEGIRKPSPVKLEKRALAKANAPFFDSGTGETNKIRAKEGDMGLESASETLRPELIDKIREPNVADEHTIRPSGATPESRASLAKAGTPNSTFSASGFFPDDFKGKTIEAGEPSWSIRLKELETREWNGGKLTDPEQKELLGLHKQAREEYGSYANWFEKMGAEKDYVSGVFGDEKQKQAFMPPPHIEREAERLGLQYKGTMGDNGQLLIFNDPITKSTISIKADAERGALQEKLRASREKFGASDATSFMPDAPMSDEHMAALPERQRMIAEEARGAGAEIWNDGTVTVYHATTADKARQIAKSGTLIRPSDAPDSYGVYVSSSQSVASDYGDGTLVKLRVKLSDLNPDDVFPGRRMDFLIKTREGKYTPTEISHMPDTTEPIPEPKEPQNIKSLRVAQAPKKDEKADPIDFKIGTKGSGYNTPLTAKEVIEFDKWKAKFAPKDSGKDYDLRGAFKAVLKPTNGHWPDTFKKPNHPTFSRESVYADETAGTWHGETFVPAKKAARK